MAPKSVDPNEFAMVMALNLYSMNSFCLGRRAVAKMKAIEEDKEILHRTPTGRIPAIKRPYSCK